MGDFDKFKNSPGAERLTDILAHIIKERPVDGLQLFESLAHFARDGKLVPDVKASPYLTDQPKPRSQLKEGCFDDVAWAEAFADAVAPLKAKPKAKAEGEEEEEAAPEGDEEGQEEEQKGELTDVVQEQENFNNLGVGLREHDAYRVYVWLKKLLEKNSANTKDTTALKSARFWGKIICNAAPPGGKPRDYYIAECEVDPDADPYEAEGGDDAGGEGDEEGGGKGPETILKTLNDPYKAKSAPEVKKEEPRQRGVNFYVYYVTTSDDLCGWRKLEDVKPGHIQAARKIKKLFTGDLDAPVNCHPPFPDRAEQYYLRAQIARITHGCKVAPRGIYTEPEPPEPPEEGEPPINWAFPTEGEWQIPAVGPDPGISAPESADASGIEGILGEADEKERESALNDHWAEERPFPAVYRMWGEGYLHDKLMEIENWVHTEPPILRSQGRATEFKPEEAEEEGGGGDEEPEEPPPEKKEPVNPMLSMLARDASLTFPSHSKSKCPPWVVRKAYAQPTDLATRTYLVKSLRWPGACCYASVRNNRPGAECVNVYIGDGLKGGEVSIYAPPVPGMGATEFPTPGDVLQVDCTPDDEAVYQPPPDAPPEAEGGDDEEGEGEGEDE